MKGRKNLSRNNSESTLFSPSSSKVPSCAGKVPVGLTVLAAALALVTSSCKPPPPPALPPPVVQVMEVTSTNAPTSIEFIGQLDSPQNVEVRARVEAFVEKVLFTEGTEVKEGDPLFTLDKKPFEERIAAARGMLAEAKAGLNKYEKDVARLQPLAAKRAIPQQDLDNAIASVAVGEGNVQSAEARVSSALIDLGYCDVKAPASGLIGAKQVSVGSLVGKGDPTLLATISQLDPIWFYCNVGEVDYLKANASARRTGKTVKDLAVALLLSDGSEHPDKGRFVFLDRAVDIKTGTIRVRVEFPNPNKNLRPGMFARIKVDSGARPDSILVPERAVQELQGKQFVWVIDASNKASQRSVTVGETLESRVVIAEGLKVGERIVTEGIQKVREGALVQPKTAGEVAKQAEERTAKGEAKPGKE
jgi:membrane fusion protein (multidrug efflux system)